MVLSNRIMVSYKHRPKNLSKYFFLNTLNCTFTYSLKYPIKYCNVSHDFSIFSQCQLMDYILYIYFHYKQFTC